MAGKLPVVGAIPFIGQNSYSLDLASSAQAIAIVPMGAAAYCEGLMRIRLHGHERIASCRWSRQRDFRTLRTNERFVARRVVPHLYPPGAAATGVPRQNLCRAKTHALA